MSLVVSQINIYPIKSLGGVVVQSAIVEERGLQYDRRWMLADTHNRFLTQRKFAKMALLKVSIEPYGLQVNAPGMPALQVPFAPQTGESIQVTVWDDTCRATVVSKEANEWFSGALQKECKLVYMPDDSPRPVDGRYAKNDEIVSFADAYPFLLIGEASFTDLNNRLPEPVPMDRFRPNLVISTAEPFAEDQWATVGIGDALFHLVKPCARCVLTTIDQQTGIASKEPLKTLASYRTFNNKVLFGQNVLSAQALGKTIHTGSPVTVVRKK